MMSKPDPLRYPIGYFVLPELIDQARQQQAISVIERFPKELSELLSHADEAMLNKRYRPEGWTVLQVVHHCADSHFNAFMRFKLALTEEEPTIKPYMEDLWAMLPDSQMDIAPSLQILHGLHKRWAVLLYSLTETQFARRFVHPERGKTLSLQETLFLYEWHCQHHWHHVNNALALV